MSHSSAFIFKKVIFSVKFSKRDPLREVWWLILETRTHRLTVNMFVLTLRRDHFSN